MTEQTLTGKQFWLSKTLWVNLLAVLGLYMQMQSGFIFDPTMQAGLLCLVNMFLRTITKEPIIW
jgi:hypothetical protein